MLADPAPDPPEQDAEERDVETLKRTINELWSRIQALDPMTETTTSDKREKW